MDRAIENGHLEIVKFLHSNREKVASSTRLAGNGDLEITKCLRKRQSHDCKIEAMAKAAGKRAFSCAQVFP